MKFQDLIKLMLKEEYRFHTSYTSKLAFLFFPFIIVLIGFFAGASVSELAKHVAIPQLQLSVSISIFFYGLVAGYFGFLGKESMKRFSGVKFLVHTHEHLPLNLRTIFLSLYIREILFYLSLTVVPLTLGLTLSLPLSKLSLIFVLVFFAMLSISFIAGMSFSYFIANLYRRHSKFYLLLIGAYTLSIILSTLIFKLYNTLLLREIGDFIYALAFILFNSLIGTIAISEEEIEKFKPTQVVAPKYLKLKISPFLIKEFLDLKRSNTLPKILFSFLFPLIFLSLLFWFIERNIKIGFSSVSYGIFTGFFCLVIYSWLNNIEALEFYNLLPISVPEIIKTKVKAHFYIALLFIPVFILGVSAVANELFLLPIVLFVSFSNLVYISLAVAWLTGLRVNVYLFNPKILVKFCVFALLPQVPLAILSFAPSFIAIIFIVFGCGLLLIASLLLWEGIDEKWSKENFGF
ncbi:MAG: hypothetical protein QMC98_01030 [Candidatus Thermoplasmatota archaeon]|nr:hypothetical protein [Candidatus Thermoplasmatota archaeon]